MFTCLTYQIHLPYTLVLSHRKGRKSSIKRMSHFGDAPLFYQDTQVEFPDLRHLVQCYEGPLKRVVQGVEHPTGYTEIARSFTTFF